MRRPDGQVVAVSSFTAGTLLRDCQATVLPPGLSQHWFDSLTKATAARQPLRLPRIRLATAFRLVNWQDKGLPELMAAIAALGRSDISLTICGSGHPPLGLLHVVTKHPWCTLRVSLSDGHLADESTAADLFVLATRTRAGRA